MTARRPPVVLVIARTRKSANTRGVNGSANFYLSDLRLLCQVPSRELISNLITLVRTSETWTRVWCKRCRLYARGNFSDFQRHQMQQNWTQAQIWPIWPKGDAGPQCAGFSGLNVSSVKPTNLRREYRRKCLEAREDRVLWCDRFCADKVSECQEPSPASALRPAPCLLLRPASASSRASSSDSPY